MPCRRPRGREVELEESGTSQFKPDPSCNLRVYVMYIGLRTQAMQQDRLYLLKVSRVHAYLNVPSDFSRTDKEGSL